MQSYEKFSYSAIKIEKNSLRHNFWKNAANIRSGLAVDFVGRNAVGFGEAIEDVGNESGLVALTAMGHGRHIRAVGFEDDAVEGNGGRQVVGQVAFLERENAADAEHETLESEEFAGFDWVAGEAVEHAAGQVVFVFPQDFHHLVLRLATVNHQRQARLDRPTNLFLEGGKLLLLELASPIEIEADFADG